MVDEDLRSPDGTGLGVGPAAEREPLRADTGDRDPPPCPSSTWTSRGQAERCSAVDSRHEARPTAPSMANCESARLQPMPVGGVARLDDDDGRDDHARQHRSHSSEQRAIGAAVDARPAGHRQRPRTPVSERTRRPEVQRGSALIWTEDAGVAPTGSRSTGVYIWRRRCSSILLRHRRSMPSDWAAPTCGGRRTLDGAAVVAAGWTGLGSRFVLPVEPHQAPRHAWMRVEGGGNAEGPLEHLPDERTYACSPDRHDRRRHLTSPLQPSLRPRHVAPIDSRILPGVNISSNPLRVTRTAVDSHRKRYRHHCGHIGGQGFLGLDAVLTSRPRPTASPGSSGSGPPMTVGQTRHHASEEGVVEVGSAEVPDPVRIAQHPRILSAVFSTTQT